MKKFQSILLIGLFSGLFLFLFLFYSPYSFFREFFITTSMTTKSHQFLARFFYSDEDILKVMRQNRVLEVNEITDLKKIHFASHFKNQLYQMKKIYGNGYSGYLVEIYDPSKIHLIVSSKLGEAGETSLEIGSRQKCKIVMNAVGFYDPDWSSTGEIPHGTVIQNGKIISAYGSSNVGGGFAGFTREGKLFLGKVSVDDVLEKKIVDAVEFGPFLIINGKSSKVIGNGGFGIAPRTAIGQRRDGTVLFLVVNGRIPSSLGASVKDLIEIMKKNGAYNAVNMDGGSSSSLIVRQKIINKPVGGGENGLRKLPVFWCVK